MPAGAMKVQDMMSRDPATCGADESLVAAARILWERDCGIVPVVDGRGVPVGVVTDRDVCMAAYTRGRRLDEIPVHTVMAQVVSTCRSDEPVVSALEVMRQMQVRRLPVVDEDGRLCGVLSITDIVRAARGDGATSAAVIATLAAIGAPRRPRHADAVLIPVPRAAGSPAAAEASAAEPKGRKARKK
jgi:CBS domain-containing protein